MPRDPHPLSARFLENSVFKKKVLNPQEKKTGSTEEGEKICRCEGAKMQIWRCEGVKM